MTYGSKNANPKPQAERNRRKSMPLLAMVSARNYRQSQQVKEAPQNQLFL